MPEIGKPQQSGIAIAVEKKEPGPAEMIMMGLDKMVEMDPEVQEMVEKIREMVSRVAARMNGEEVAEDMAEKARGKAMGVAPHEAGVAKTRSVL
jgi:hypothetical protein